MSNLENGTEFEIKELVNIIYSRLWGINKQEGRTKLKRIQENRSVIAMNVIRLYYKHYQKTSIVEVIENFKRKYITNETILEHAGKEEKLGLGEVYNYIQAYDTNKRITIFEILKLHQLLFSKCPHPEVGGLLRNGDVFLPGSNIEIPGYGLVPLMISDLNKRVEELMSIATDPKLDIILYLQKAIDIKAEIVKIHPFDDGNGRISRAFLNLMFKKAGIPPVYVTTDNKQAYGKAMNKALVDKDPKELYEFYFGKIFESIYELDIEPNMVYIKEGTEIIGR